MKKNKRHLSLGTILALSLLLPNCAEDQGFVYYENHQSSSGDLAYLQSKADIRQSHQVTIERLRDRRKRMVQSNAGVSNNIAYSTTTTNYIANARGRVNLAPSNRVFNNRVFNERASLELRIDEYERAVQQSREKGYSKYQTIKVKVFPIEKIRGKAYAPYPWVQERDFRNVSLENKNSFRVREVKITDGKVVKDFGTFQKIDFEFGKPVDQLSNENRAYLYREASLPNPTSSIDLSTLAVRENEEARDGSQFEATSLVVTPVKKPDDGAVAADGRRKSSAEYLNAGFSTIKWQGIQPRRGSTSEEQTYFYRGSFEIAYSHRYRYSQEEKRVWTVINLVDIEDYIYSVASKELGQAAVSEPGSENARKAQVIATRTYVVLKADRARTGKMPRLWDLLPTTADQAYLGVEAEIGAFKSALTDTRNEILGVPRRNGKARLASANYFGCTDDRTIYNEGCKPDGTGCATELKARIVPGTISCDYAGNRLRTKRDFRGQIVAYGHGRGMCQFCALHLATVGWDDATRRPSQDATYPENYTDSWNHEHILKYFYDNSDIYNISDATLE